MAWHGNSEQERRGPAHGASQPRGGSAPRNEAESDGEALSPPGPEADRRARSPQGGEADGRTLSARDSKPDSRTAAREVPGSDRRWNRRSFLRSFAAGTAGAALLGSAARTRGEEAAAAEAGDAEAAADSARTTPAEAKRFDPDAVRSNVEVAQAAPRTPSSMPGPYPGRVCEVTHPRAVVDGRPQAEAAAAMLAAGLRELTGEADAAAAWRRFVSPTDRVGLKLNPIGGKLLANSHELVAAIVAGLESAGVPRGNILLWDRREADLRETGFTAERRGGFSRAGTEYSVVEEGKEQWRGLDRLDQSVFYEFDLPGEYDEETMPYMLNGGTKSFYTRILTEQVDKVINVPVLKNAGPSVTLCLKNLAYGATSNTARGHQIWSRFIAEACAFPPIRDKTVLHIIDGLRGCYDGGPAAVARYIWSSGTIWLATDPVAADRVGWEFIHAKRVKEGLAQEGDLETAFRQVDKLARAEKLGLGRFAAEGIERRRVALG